MGLNEAKYFVERGCHKKVVPVGTTQLLGGLRTLKINFKSQFIREYHMNVFIKELIFMQTNYIDKIIPVSGVPYHVIMK